MKVRWFHAAIFTAVTTVAAWALAATTLPPNPLVTTPPPTGLQQIRSLVIVPANASYAVPPPGLTITLSAGDVLIGTGETTPAHVSCTNGYYIRATALAAKQTYATALAAFTANSFVRLWYDPELPLAGTTNLYCQLVAIELYIP